MKGHQDATARMLYLATASIRGGRHLLLNEHCARIVLESLAWMRAKGLIGLFGFVLLPSRLRFLCSPEEGTMEKILARFEEFTEARMQKALLRRGRNFLLQSFYSEKRAAGSVWGSLRADPVRGKTGAWDALRCMHREPCAGEWRLACVPADYSYSSAGFYEAGKAPVIGLDDLRFLEDAPRMAQAGEADSNILPGAGA